MSDFGALYEYIMALEEAVPEAEIAKLKDRRPGMLPELKSVREAREKEEREVKAKEEREAKEPAKTETRPPSPAPRPTTQPAA